MIAVAALLMGLAAASWVGTVPLRVTGAAHREDQPRSLGAAAGPRLDPAVACELLAVAIAAGSSVPGALEALGEAAEAPQVAVAGRLLRLGAKWEEAVEEIEGTWAEVVGPLRGAWCHGVDPAPALRVAAATVRARRAALARVEAERLAVHLVLPLGLCFLPAFILLGLVPVVLSVGGGLLGL